jgi:hypothetical protein
MSCTPHGHHQPLDRESEYEPSTTAGSLPLLPAAPPLPHHRQPPLTPQSCTFPQNITATLAKPWTWIPVHTHPQAKSPSASRLSSDKRSSDTPRPSLKPNDNVGQPRAALWRYGDEISSSSAACSTKMSRSRALRPKAVSCRMHPVWLISALFEGGGPAHVVTARLRCLSAILQGFMHAGALDGAAGLFRRLFMLYCVVVAPSAR